MKKFLLIFLFVTSYGFAQNSGITYQAVIYNPNGEELPGVNNPYAALTEQSVCLQFGIIDASGTIEYQENVQVTTDAFGMVNLLIGTHLQTSGYAASFSAINWGTDAKFLKVDINIKGNCTNFEELSNQPFTYVPFAYYSPASDIPGPAGEDGNGILNTINNTDNTITFEYTDGTSFTTDSLTGEDGGSGLSAYEVWISLGNTGTEQEFIDSLNGLDGSAGLKSLIKTTDESQGSNCENGGTKIETGIDTNNDGLLDASEIDSSQTRYICNGNDGLQGEQGLQGPAGSNDGTNSIGNGYVEYSLSNIAEIKLSSDGQNIIIRNNNPQQNTNSIKVYNLNDGILSQKGQVLSDYTKILGINSDGSRIAVTSSSTPEIAIFDLINNNWILNAILTSNQASYGRLSDDGNTLITITNSSSSIKYFSFNTANLQWEELFNESIFTSERYDFTSNLQYFTTSFPIDGANYNGSLKIYKNNINSIEQIGQAIYGDDELDFLGDHSSISENGNVVAVTLRSNKVKVYENVSENWIEKGNPIDLFMRPEKAFISADGNELIVLIKSLYSYPMSIIRFTYQNNSWSQKGSVTLTKNTDTTTLPSDYESGTLAIRNRFDTEPNSSSDSFPDVYTLLIKKFD